jgi:heme ABC exporter ATP-binding subunit CcmA
LPTLPTHHRQSIGGFGRSHLRRRPRRVSFGAVTGVLGSLGAAPELAAGESAGASRCSSRSDAGPSLAGSVRAGLASSSDTHVNLLAATNQIAAIPGVFVRLFRSRIGCGHWPSLVMWSRPMSASSTPFSNAAPSASTTPAGDPVMTTTPNNAELDAVIAIKDVVAVLGNFPALAGASLTVQRGEIVLLKGPNGAGKTTLLRLCAGLLPVERGAASILGFDLATQRQLVRPHVGLLGHQNGLYLDLSVHENVEFWGRTAGASPAEISSAMSRMGVAERLADVPVRKLSAGQKRRTSLACLVARRAQVWLLDEPHAGLDAAGRDELDVTLAQAARSGATILVASHELERAGGLATRSVEVVAGQVVTDTKKPGASG